MSTDQCLWCRCSDHGELKGVIGIHVDDFLIGLAKTLGEKLMSEIKSLYRWGSWKTSESEFAGILVRQRRDFCNTVDLEDCTNKFITEALITRERSRQRTQYVAMCTWHSLLESSANVSSVCCECEFTC